MEQELKIIAFSTQAAWEKWLSKNYMKEDGVWIRMFKKDSQIKSINHDQALDEALCYGWIDGQTRSYDEKSYLQKFTPRRSKSTWSQRNTEHIVRLTQLGKMKPSGIAQVEAAKADGRWAQAYSAPSNAVPPKDFLKELAKNPKAEAFFKTLNKTNTYAIIWRIETAKKSETKERRIKALVQMLSERKKLY